MKIAMVLILLLGGCSALLPSKFKRDKAMISPQKENVTVVKKV
jgi:hypothetical protein